MFEDKTLVCKDIHYDGREAHSHHILEGELETIKDDHKLV